MGKRVIAESHVNNQNITPISTGQRNIRKRKINSITNKNKSLRINSSHNNSYWHENDDEDSSSNDGLPLGIAVATPRNASSKQANNSSILLNNSFNLSLTQNDNNSTITESPKPVYTLRPSVVNGTILYDLTQRPWRLGRPIGKGNFGEIFLASNNSRIPVTNENAKFVVKIEPHSNGPLFVEIHCLMNTAKKYCPLKDEETTGTGKRENPTAPVIDPTKLEPTGIPDYIASGSHHFGNARYRFLVLPRFDRDLHSLIKKSRVHQKSVLTLAIHIINVLENLHDRGYCHNDVKAQNLMISKCKYLTQQKKKTTTSSSTFPKGNDVQQQHIKTSKYDDHYDEKQQTTDSGNSSEQEANDEDDEDFVVKRKYYNKGLDYEDEEEESTPEDDEDEDFDDGATTNSMNSTSLDTYHTPLNKNTQDKGKRASSRNVVPYSGSNPVRSCRRQKPNSIYDEMVKSHYLRPHKRISYSEFFNEDGASVKSQNCNSSSDMHSNSSGDESEDFVPLSVSRLIKSSAKKSYTTNLESRRLTRRQEKLLSKRDAQMHCKNTDKDCIKNKLKVDKNENLSNVQQNEQEWIEVTEERIFLIDYGLASKYIDKGVHRPFVMDQRRAHDGTLEFTSRDAHMGAHSRRSDMECLGYNLLFWTLGYLPWKEAATNQQQEKVHRAKEFLMTDVRELLIQIYGKQVPKYLGEYLHLVGLLAYHERPDYNSYRSLFEREYQQLGYPLSDMRLNMKEIQQTCVRVREEVENKIDFFETNKTNGTCNMVMNIMQNHSVGGTPFQERTISNRVSPKNLRSKSGKKGSKKKFSWTEILSQDPDQIARERAEKEFDREEELSDVQLQRVRRYQGKPTRAIMELIGRLGRSVNEYEEETVQLESEFKQKHTKNENKMELDQCDNAKLRNNNCEVEDMEVDNEAQDDQALSSEDGETDATETSEKCKRREAKVSSSAVKSKNSKRKSNKSTRKAVARKLILKTPNGNNNTLLTATPICNRTRRKLAVSTIIDLVTPSPGITKAKIAKSTARKRDSTNKTVTPKEPLLNVLSSATTSSAAGEQRQQTFDKNRRYRSKRRIIKTDRTASESLQDDSNSNFSADVCKVNTEAIYSRNYRK